MKKYILVLFCLFIVPSLLSAANDAQFGNGVNLLLTNENITLTVSGSRQADSVTVNPSNLSIVLSDNSNIEIRSANKYVLNESPTTHTKLKECTASYSSILLLGPTSGTATVTITPDTSKTCSGGSGSVASGGTSSSGAGGGGGGGGGGTGPSVTVPPAPLPEPEPEAKPQTVATTADPELVELVELLIALGVIPSGKAEKARSVLATEVSTEKPAAPALPAVSAVFTRSLDRGMRGEDAKRLQKLLNSDPDTQVAASGIGSPGNETNYFGSLTETAVKKFQAKYDIVSSGTPGTTGYGRLGPKTIAKLKEIFGN